MVAVPNPPVVVLEAWSPVGCPQQCLDRTGQIDKQVAHEEKPGGWKGRKQIKNTLIIL